MEDVRDEKDQAGDSGDLWGDRDTDFHSYSSFVLCMFCFNLKKSKSRE